MEKQKKVLCLFDYGPKCYTGYATVSRNIVAQLKKHFGEKLRLDICAINNFDPPTSEYDGTVNVISGKLSQETEGVSKFFEGGDDFGRLEFLNMLQKGNYDGVFIINDLGTIAGMVTNMAQIAMQKLQEGKKMWKSVIYFPIDGPIVTAVKNKEYKKEALKEIPKDFRFLFNPIIRQLDVLDFFDHAVTYTYFGLHEIVKRSPKLSGHLDVIYHGINTNDFYPLPEDQVKRFRKQYYGKNCDKFIVGVVNRNQSRKDIPTAIQGFMEAKKNWTNPSQQPFLYLHMQPDDPKGWDLNRFMSLTGLEEGKDYMFARGDDKGQVDIETLNKIYNSLDVSLSTARGGGRELPVTEAMACKVPCIIPDHTSLGEIGGHGERAYMLKELLPVCDISDNVPRWMCHYEEVGEAIIQIAEKWSSPKQLPETLYAYDWVTDLTWDKVCEEWIDIFEEILK